MVERGESFAPERVPQDKPIQACSLGQSCLHECKACVCGHNAAFCRSRGGAHHLTNHASRSTLELELEAWPRRGPRARPIGADCRG